MDRDLFFLNAQPHGPPSNVRFDNDITTFEGPRHRASTLALAEAAGSIVNREIEIQEGRIDPVTGLQMRLAFEQDLRSRLESAGPGDVSVIFLDLDGLKRVNDGMSHEAGDQYLKLVADSVAGDTRPYDSVSRIGGDELCVILDHRYDDPRDADKKSRTIEDIAEGMAKKVEEGLSSNGVLRSVEKLGVSRGCATLQDGDDHMSLLARADLGCKINKETRYSDTKGQLLRQEDTRLKG